MLLIHVPQSATSFAWVVRQNEECQFDEEVSPVSVDRSGYERDCKVEWYSLYVGRSSDKYATGSLRKFALAFSDRARLLRCRAVAIRGRTRRSLGTTSAHWHPAGKER